MLASVAVIPCLQIPSLGAERPGPPIVLEVAVPAAACDLSGPSSDEPLGVLIPVGPEQARDAAFLEPALACAAERHLEISVRIEPPTAWQAAPDPYAAVSGWLTDLDAALQAVGGRVAAFQLGRRPDLSFEPKAYTFLVEKVGTALRSIAPDAALVFGSLGAESGPWLDAIDARRLAPHVDGVALEDPLDLATWAERLGRDYPGTWLWLRAQTPAAGPAGWLRRYHEARAQGVAAVVTDAAVEPAIARTILNLARALPSRFEASLEGSAAGTAQFADPLGPERAVLLPGSEPLGLTLGPEPVTRVRVVGLQSGLEMESRLSRPEGESGPTRIEGIDQTPGPFLVRYIVLREPRSAPETVGVTGEEELSAEEIIARLRAVEAAQSRRLFHYQANATLSYHYRAEALNQSIDVASINRFYWKGGVGEYEETDLFINGARWRGKAPSLPFITPEKVKEVPIEIRLDQSYAYRLKGRDTVDGQPAYLIAFEPVEKERVLYSGEVWIHRESFHRLRIRMVQQGLAEPITSNADTIDYGPVALAPEGAAAAEAATWWLPLRGYRQMVFTVLGRTVAVERRASYDAFVINGASWERQREQAYASDHPILKDDASGTTNLVVGKDGVRSDHGPSLRNVALFSGLGLTTRGSVGAPFAGLNYFDFDWRGTGTQFDLAWAGPLVDLAWTDPGLGDSRFELTLEGRVTGVPDRFRKVDEEGRRNEEDLKVLEQRAWVTLARPLTSYQKAELQVELDYDDFRQADNTDPNFVLPATRPVTITTARWRYHRAGTLLDLTFSEGIRFGWQDWGIPGSPEGHSGKASEDSFQRWTAGVLKSFYPTRKQKISFGAALLAGDNLDRFSRFRVGDFRSARVRGYNSFDVTFDRGASAQADYLLTLPRGGMSLELGAEILELENKQDLTRRGYLAGGGAALAFHGPWDTLMSVRASVGLGTTVGIGTSGVGLRVLMIKTFDSWPFRRHPPSRP